MADIFYDMSFEEYCKIPAINASAIKKGITPSHLNAYLTGEMESGDTDDRRFGRGIHCGVLEARLLSDRFPVSTNCVGPVKARNGALCGNFGKYRSTIALHQDDQRGQAIHMLTAAGFRVRHESESGSLYFVREKEHIRVSDHDANDDTKQWMDDNRATDIRIGEKDSPLALVPTLRHFCDDIQPLTFWYCGTHKPENCEQPADFLTQGEADKLQKMIAKLDASPASEFLRYGLYRSEVVIVWDRNGTLCKTRIDQLGIGPDRIKIVDLKKSLVGECDEESCQYKTKRLGYHIAAAMNVEAVAAYFGDAKPIDFYLLFQEDSAPFEPNLLEASENDLLVGQRVIDARLRLYRECLMDGRFYGYQHIPENVHQGILPDYYVESVLFPADMIPNSKE